MLYQLSAPRRHFFLRPELVLGLGPESWQPAALTHPISAAVTKAKPTIHTDGVLLNRSDTLRGRVRFLCMGNHHLSKINVLEALPGERGALSSKYSKKKSQTS